MNKKQDKSKYLDIHLKKTVILNNNNSHKSTGNATLLASSHKRAVCWAEPAPFFFFLSDTFVTLSIENLSPIFTWLHRPFPLHCTVSSPSFSPLLSQTSLSQVSPFLLQRYSVLLQQHFIPLPSRANLHLSRCSSICCML